MIEAAETCSPGGVPLRRRLASLVPAPASAPSPLAQDLRFFATAYFGALAFFLAWLA